MKEYIKYTQISKLEKKVYNILTNFGLKRAQICTYPILIVGLKTPWVRTRVFKLCTYGLNKAYK